MGAGGADRGHDRGVGCDGSAHAFAGLATRAKLYFKLLRGSLDVVFTLSQCAIALSALTRAGGGGGVHQRANQAKPTQKVKTSTSRTYRLVAKGMTMHSALALRTFSKTRRWGRNFVAGPENVFIGALMNTPDAGRHFGVGLVLTHLPGALGTLGWCRKQTQVCVCLYSKSAFSWVHHTLHSNKYITHIAM